ncbi:sporulation histidine kinase inhibitor Sda [Halalkalibacter alkalisediminis]|uniref:Sporulation histidine kinase inhibitor Sda n=1 Tax=Halalkalibacter alkalisediminis TaxID=935616 RepID=A0ABV6N9T9_9BACI|nr:sporulation histidine kinase inhibitor Sda [Halalkalibacter alkalisediminis]
MYSLTDELLLQTYYRAIEQKLNNDFIELLFNEILKRNLQSQLHPLILE